MRYTEIISSRTGSTSVAQGEDGSLVLVEVMKWGRIVLKPIQCIPQDLTVQVLPDRARIIDIRPVTARRSVWT